MYELVALNSENFYIESPAKIGLIKLSDEDVLLIDSGNDKDAGKKVRKILEEKHWCLKAIVNSHSHADHIGGNQYLQKQTGCKIYAAGIERDFSCHPLLEPSFLYGGNPPKELRHKFLMAQASDVELLTEAVKFPGIEFIPLPGHSFDMVGLRTAQDVVYLADCLSSAETLEKYQINFLVDVEAYLETLKKVMAMEASCFVPAHAAVTENIAPLAQLNMDKVYEIGGCITELCRESVTFETLLQRLFSHYELQMSFEQHALVGSTIRSYLTWLKNSGELTAEIADDQILWKSV